MKRRVPSGMKPVQTVPAIDWHRLFLSLLQYGQVGSWHSGMYSGMTWSPGFSVVTPGPHSSTSQPPSWPRIAGNAPSGSSPDNVNASV